MENIKSLKCHSKLHVLEIRDKWFKMKMLDYIPNTTRNHTSHHPRHNCEVQEQKCWFSKEINSMNMQLMDSRTLHNAATTITDFSNTDILTTDHLLISLQINYCNCTAFNVRKEHFPTVSITDLYCWKLHNEIL
jgi:hypothetical protein